MDSDPKKRLKAIKRRAEEIRGAIVKLRMEELDLIVEIQMILKESDG